MHTVIKVSTEELNQKLLDKVHDFIKGLHNPTISITIQDEDDYLETLRRSVADAEADRHLVSFTMEEFAAYKPAK